MLKHKKLLLSLIVAIAALVLVACGGAATGSEGDDEGEEQVVTIFGAFVDEDQARFEESVKPFEDETGIDIQYEGSGDFESLITVRVEGGDPPDIAAFPQPGLLADFVSEGEVIDVSTFLDESYLQEQYIQSWLDLATMEGPDGDIMAGIWYRANVKSLVWYPVPEFEEAGYEIPETWDEMLALSDQMVADGNTPWCIGIESSGATGWVATDWMEEIMLRTQPLEAYDEWVAGDLPFNSPEVIGAAEIMGEIWFNEDYVLGGTSSILTVPFGDAPAPLFDDPPGCYMHRQANFITAFFPDGVSVPEDADFFYLPPIDEEYGEPVLFVGDIYGMYNDRPEVRQVMEYLTTGESARGWVEAGGFISPHNDSSLDWYPSEADRGYAEILQNATSGRFDASDLMPGAVGVGTFWTAMVDYVSSEGEGAEQIMTNVDNSWPE